MSEGTTIRASIQLAVDAGWRHTGWRATCEIEGLVASDGSGLFGFEAAPLDADRFEPGAVTTAELRFWAPEFSELEVEAEKKLRIFEGKTQVAIGKVVDVTRE